jgi:actin-related protein
MTEPAWNTKEKRVKLTEMVFEKFNCSGFFLVKSPVSSAFSNGRATAMVIDCGATHTSAIAGTCRFRVKFYFNLRQILRWI